MIKIPPSNLLSLPTLSLLFSFLMISACGSSSGGSTTDTDNSDTDITPETYTGVFIDSPVEGLKFETATQSGFTNSAGEFIFQLGEQITFSIGGIELPAINAKTQISPLDVFSTEDYAHSGVINLARFLQSLDMDGLASNGIKLNANIHTLAAQMMVDFTSDTFEQDVTELLIDNNAIYISLIDEQQAIDHLRDSLNDPVTAACGNDHEKVGYSGSFSTKAHNVSGNATIIDNCTIRIENFNFDGDGLSVFFYGAIDSDFENGFSIGKDLLGQSFSNDTVTIKLPNNKSLDDLNQLSVWCVPASADFGSLTFTAP